MGLWDPGCWPTGANLTHSRQSTKGAERRQTIAHGTGRGAGQHPALSPAPEGAAELLPRLQMASGGTRSAAPALGGSGACPANPQLRNCEKIDSGACSGAL